MELDKIPGKGLGRGAAYIVNQTGSKSIGPAEERMKIIFREKDFDVEVFESTADLQNELASQIFSKDNQFVMVLINGDATTNSGLFILWNIYI